MRSGRLRPWFWYCLATETTKRRLARVSFSRASWSPLRMRWASSTSSSGVTSSSRPISCRYLSSDALSRLVMDLVILSCLIILLQKLRSVSCVRNRPESILIGSSLLAEAKVESLAVHGLHLRYKRHGGLLGLGNDIFGVLKRPITVHIEDDTALPWHRHPPSCRYPGKQSPRRAQAQGFQVSGLAALRRAP